MTTTMWENNVKVAIGPQDDLVRCSEPRGRTVDEQVPELTSVAMPSLPRSLAAGDSCNG